MSSPAYIFRITLSIRYHSTLRKATGIWSHNVVEEESLTVNINEENK